MFKILLDLPRNYVLKIRSILQIAHVFSCHTKIYLTKSLTSLDFCYPVCGCDCVLLVRHSELPLVEDEHWRNVHYYDRNAKSHTVKTPSSNTSFFQNWFAYFYQTVVRNKTQQTECHWLSPLMFPPVRPVSVVHLPLYPMFAATYLLLVMGRTNLLSVIPSVLFDMVMGLQNIIALIKLSNLPLSPYFLIIYIYLSDLGEVGGTFPLLLVAFPLHATILGKGSTNHSPSALFLFQWRSANVHQVHSLCPDQSKVLTELIWLWKSIPW